MVLRKKDDVLVTEAVSEQMTNAALRRPKAKREKAEGTMIGAASAAPPPTSRDPETTGSVQATPSPAGPGRTIRVIAPDIIPVPMR
jgi:hypothetical protein